MTHELRNLITANLYLLCAFVAVVSAIWLVCIVRAGSKPTPEPEPEPVKRTCENGHSFAVANVSGDMHVRCVNPGCNEVRRA